MPEFTSEEEEDSSDCQEYIKEVSTSNKIGVSDDNRITEARC
jgi:hypothetical protein